MLFRSVPQSHNQKAFHQICLKTQKGLAPRPARFTLDIGQSVSKGGAGGGWRGVNAGRQQKKRFFRGLWITRLTAAVKAHGLRYSQFIHGVQKAGIKLNRKELSELAIHDAKTFEAICGKAKKAIA